MFATLPTQKSSVDAKRSGKPDGNTLVDILCSMTLLGNTQSLFSVAWPLLNFSWLGKAAYRLGVHWKKHVWGCISVKGLQRGRREIFWCHILEQGLLSHECLLQFELWGVFSWWSLRKIHAVGSKQSGKRGCTVRWACCKWLAIVRVESCCIEVGDLHKASKLVLRSVQTVLPCTCPQPPRESKLHEFVKGFFFFFFKEHLLKPFCYLKCKIWLILPALVISTAFLVVCDSKIQHLELSVFSPPPCIKPVYEPG